MNPKWTRAAMEDLDEYLAEIEQDKPSAAEKWEAKIKAKAEMVARLPQAGRVVPEFDREDLREVFHASHRIVYLVQVGGVEIIRVFHGARMLRQSDISEA